MVAPEASDEGRFADQRAAALMHATLYRMKIFATVAYQETRAAIFIARHTSKRAIERIGTRARRG